MGKFEFCPLVGQVALDEELDDEELVEDATPNPDRTLTPCLPLTLSPTWPFFRVPSSSSSFPTTRKTRRTLEEASRARLDRNPRPTRNPRPDPISPAFGPTGEVALPIDF